MRDNIEFFSELGRRYNEFEAHLDASTGENPTRQLWHTPTELFRPYYGEAIARYLVSNYHMTSYPYHDLIIYEMGAGRGTLMLNILDYIRDMDPSVYDRTKYRVIEISSSLAELQKKNLAGDHADKVEIINKSIFDWTESVSSPCFFLAMEVWDNFPHDGIRYDLATEAPLQATVLIDAGGEFYEFYTPELDPVAARFFRVRHAATGGRYPRPYPTSPTLRKMQRNMPFAGNLSDPEFIPTRLLQFFDVLERCFPGHRLLSSDFSSLPESIKGMNAPVVQTRFEGKMIPVSTPLVCFHPHISLGRRNENSEVLTESTGPPRLLRHPLPHRLPDHRVDIPRRDGQAHPRAAARGVHAPLGVRRGHRDAHGGEPSLVVLPERECHVHCLGSMQLDR